ncbi:hypothetical protein [Mycolicibacterium sediminis]|uniref:hypothetical protein n=1 Tax=Mycolicibacterium sediminis TaxID=1286180 RepID=UPI0013D1EEBC|nr:hypothetical protein [Mycolicibacterium sediminis]
MTMSTAGYRFDVKVEIFDEDVRASDAVLRSKPYSGANRTGSCPASAPDVLRERA